MNELSSVVPPAMIPLGDYPALVFKTGVEFLAASQESDDFDDKRQKWVAELNKVVRENGYTSCQKGSALFFLGDVGGDFSFAGLIPQKRICQEITREKDNILHYHLCLTLEVCEKLVEKSFELEKHKKRRYCLDQTIKRLLRLEKEATSLDQAFKNRVALALARAYYRRGKIIRPKGFTVPAKKIETLHNADNLLKEIVASETTEALRLRAMVHIDWAALLDDEERDEKPEEYREVLDAAVTTITDAASCDEEAVLIVLARAEYDADWAKNGGKALLGKLKTNAHASDLHKARACWILCDVEESLDLARKAVRAMVRKSLPFSHEDWRILVRLLGQMWKNDVSGIDAVILEIWQKARDLERQTKNGLHVRWYWSRQRDLYDLAFHAAGENFEKKAQIADSLKARPALHLGQAEDIGLAVAQMEMGLLDRYITDMGTPSKAPGNGEMPTTVQEETWPELPEPWLAVHFYLSNGFGDHDGKKQGYALIHDSEKNGKDSWCQKEFNYFPIWAAYMTWQENYQAVKEKAAPDLERLCKAMGKEMFFLFEATLFPPERPVVFVPHDFLHRLPIHAAIPEIGSTKILFASSHSTTYLPAWWIAGITTDTVPCDNAPSCSLLLENGTCDNHHGGVEVLKLVNEQGGVAIKGASFGDWISHIYNPASLRILYCHGQASAVNPFASRLLLANGGVGLLDILASNRQLPAGRYILGACETDLVVPESSTLDEHFSISTGMLQKGAGTILGTLWEAWVDQAISLITKTVGASKESLTMILTKWLNDYIAACNGNISHDDIYSIATFKIQGRPTKPSAPMVEKGD